METLKIGLTLLKDHKYTPYVIMGIVGSIMLTVGYYLHYFHKNMPTDFGGMVMAFLIIVLWAVATLYSVLAVWDYYN